MSELKVLLHRRSLDLRSGAGQLLHAQLLGLEAAHIPAVIACERGALKFWLRTLRWPRRAAAATMPTWQREGWVVIDHGASVPTAELVYVHNLAREARRFAPGSDLSADADREHAFFGRLAATTLVVANSQLVKRALVREFAIPDERVAVLYPGFDARRFNLEAARRWRPRARSSLGMDERVPLVGFVTSGDFAKRGLDTFLDAAALIAATRPDVRFLVVGSKELPRSAHDHPLVRDGRLLYRPKSRAPEPWFAALDLFLYAARFEEFGMVLSEAQAMGVPVLTSRRVGAAECLPADYAPWLLDEPAAEPFARHALALLDDASLRARLAASGAAGIGGYDRRAYVAGTLAQLAVVRQQRSR